MRLEILKNSIEIVPETPEDEYYIEQYMHGACELVVDRETETVKPTHADEAEKYITNDQTKLVIWPLQIKNESEPSA